MQGYELLIETLKDEGITDIFGLMAEDTMNLMSEIEEHHADDITITHARHEQGAMAMADGYARATNDISVGVVGRGPAVAQTGTSLVTARKGGSNVVLLVPTSSSTESYDIKAFEQEAYLRSTIENVETVHSPETFHTRLADVFREARHGNGPIALQIPDNILNDEVPPSTNNRLPESRPPTPPAIEPDDTAISDAIDLYLDSDATVPPLILAGRGAVAADAKDELIALAERTSGLLATTLQTRGFFADHPFSIGFIGTWGGNLANEHLADADCIFAVGCSLNPKTTDNGRLFRDDAKVIHIDANADAINRYLGVNLGVVGDAKQATNRLVEELKERDIHRDGALWSDRLENRIAATPALDDDEFPSQPDTMDPRDVIKTINDLIPEDRLVTTDGGHFTRWVVDGIETPSHNKFIWTLDFASIGQGLGGSIGATVARPSLPSVLFTGDAGFLMAIQELDTAARHEIPITVVIMNDSSLGSEYHNLAKTGGYTESALMATPDFATIAEGFGAEGYTITDIDSLRAREDVFTDSRDTPVVLDCHINPDVRHRSKQ